MWHGEDRNEMMMMGADEGDIEPGGNESKPPSEKLKCEHCDYTSNSPVEIKITYGSIEQRGRKGKGSMPPLLRHLETQGVWDFTSGNPIEKLLLKERKPNLREPMFQEILQWESNPAQNRMQRLKDPNSKVITARISSSFTVRRKYGTSGLMLTLSPAISMTVQSRVLFNLRKHLSGSHFDSHRFLPADWTTFKWHIFLCATFTTMEDLDENRPLGGECGRGDEEEDWNDPSSGKSWILSEFIQWARRTIISAQHKHFLW